MKKHRLYRRGFLGCSLASAATVHVVPRWVLGAGRTAPSDVINHAVIGTGGMGMGHVGQVKDDPVGVLRAVCDADENHLRRAMQAGACDGHRDFREVLDRGDIDVVRVVTPPHWHALMSVAAAQAGCDVFCEKPMTRTIGEGQAVIDAVRRHGRMFRLNTWFRLHGGFYGLGVPVAPIKKLVINGLLGWPLTVRVSPFTGFDWKLQMWAGRTDLAPQPVPPHFDYDRWLGPAPVKPYHPHRTHGSFRGYWDYDGGGLADMGQHYLDPVQYLLDKDGTSPVEIAAHAPWPPHPDAVRMWGRVEMAYADGCRIILESGEWGDVVTRDQPYLEGPKDRIFRGFVTDPPDLKDALDGGGLIEPPPMVSDFNVSVRTRRTFGLNEENGHRSNLLVHLANAAIRTGRTLRFDPVAQRFIGDEEANRLVHQPMRAPWHL